MLTVLTVRVSLSNMHATVRSRSNMDGIAPQVYNANRFKVDMSVYPTIARIELELAKLPEFEKVGVSGLCLVCRRGWFVC